MGAGGGQGESPRKESYSAVKVSAIVRGSRVPAERADKVPAKEVRSSIVQADPSVGSRRGEAPAAKNNTLRSVHFVRLTHLTLKHKLEISMQPPYHTTHLTQHLILRTH